jgi:hypothetical protein
MCVSLLWNWQVILLSCSSSFCGVIQRWLKYIFPSSNHNSFNNMLDTPRVSRQSIQAQTHNYYFCCIYMQGVPKRCIHKVNIPYCNVFLSFWDTLYIYTILFLSTSATWGNITARICSCTDMFTVHSHPRKWNCMQVHWCMCEQPLACKFHSSASTCASILAYVN